MAANDADSGAESGGETDIEIGVVLPQYGTEIETFRETALEADGLLE